jgi:glycosyltransferase involved in cell wall biosynthesis
VPPRDPAALGAAIEELTEDADLRARLGRAAATRARAEFDQRRVAQVSLDTYARVLARRRGSR